MNFSFLKVIDILRNLERNLRYEDRIGKGIC